MNTRPEVDYRVVNVKMFSSLSARDTKKRTTYVGDVHREHDISIIQQEMQEWLSYNEYIDIVSIEQTQGMFESRVNRFPWVTISIFYRDITDEAYHKLEEEKETESEED